MSPKRIESRLPRAELNESKGILQLRLSKQVVAEAQSKARKVTFLY